MKTLELGWRISRLNQQRLTNKKMRVLFKKFGQKSFEILKELNEKYPQIKFDESGVYLVLAR